MSEFRRPALRLAPIALACGVLISAPASGQSAPPAPDTGTDGKQVIVITSTKRLQPEQAVAGTVNIVDGALLERQGAQGMEDIFRLTPGVQFFKASSEGGAVSIRGLATQTSAGFTQQGTTGIYIEDVPFTDAWGQVSLPDLAPFDLARVEVLKGPQGALYGSASLGGAVRYMLRRPTSTFEGAGQFEVNSFSGGGNGHSVHAMVNAPLGQGTALRVVAFDRADGGFIDNIGTGTKNSNTLRQRGGRIMLGSKLMSDLDVSLIALTQQTKSKDSDLVSGSVTSDQLNRQINGAIDTKWSLFNLQVNYDIAGLRITSSTARIDKRRDLVEDSTPVLGAFTTFIGLPPMPLVITNSYFKGTTNSQELRVVPLKPRDFNFVVGMFYQEGRISRFDPYTAPGGAAALGAMGQSILPNDVLALQHANAKTSEAAVFGDLDWEFAPQWTLGLGGRYFRTKTFWDLDFRSNLYEQFGIANPLILDRYKSETGNTPKVSLKYKFDANTVGHVLASRGFRFGGVNDLPPSTFNSDSVWNYEAGLRSSPSRAIDVAITVYHMDWKNLQVDVFEPSTNGLIVANIGAAKVDGVELTLGTRLASAFRVDAAVAYTDARTAVAWQAPDQTNVPIGSRLPGTARLQASLLGTYTFDIGGLRGRLTGQYSHVGSRFAEIANTNLLAAIDTIDLRLALSGQEWEGTVFVKNATDKRGAYARQSSGALYVNQPRSIGASLRYDF